MKSRNSIRFLTFFLTFFISFFLGIKTASSKSYDIIDAETSQSFISFSPLSKQSLRGGEKLAFLIFFFDWVQEKEIPLSTSVVKVPSFDFSLSNPLNLREKDEISLRDLLYSVIMQEDELSLMLLAHYIRSHFLPYSANKTTFAFCLEQMNALSLLLGNKRTFFSYLQAKSKGEKSSPHFSTANDMARFFSYGLRNPIFAFFLSQSYRDIEILRGKEKKVIFLQRNSVFFDLGVEEMLAGSCGEKQWVFLSFSCGGKEKQNPRKKIVLSFLNGDWKKYGNELIMKSKNVCKQISY